MLSHADTSEDFTLAIEALVAAHSIGYMEAVLHWCKLRNLDPEIGAEHVKRSPKIRTKLQAEARTLKMVK